MGRPRLIWTIIKALQIWKSSSREENYIDKKLILYQIMQLRLKFPLLTRDAHQADQRFIIFGQVFTEAHSDVVVICISCTEYGNVLGVGVAVDEECATFWIIGGVVVYYLARRWEGIGPGHVAARFMFQS